MDDWAGFFERLATDLEDDELRAVLQLSVDFEERYGGARGASKVELTTAKIQMFALLTGSRAWREATELKRDYYYLGH